MIREPVLARIRRVHQYDNEDRRNQKEFTAFTFTVDIVTTRGEQFKNVPIAFPSSSLDGKGFRYIPYAGVRVLVIFTTDGPIVAGYVPEHDDLDGFADSSTLQEQGAWSSSSPSGSSVFVGDRKASLTASPDSLLVLDGVNGITSLLTKNHRMLFPGGYTETQVLPDSSGEDAYQYTEQVLFKKLPKGGSPEEEYLYRYSGYSRDLSGFTDKEEISRMDGLMRLTRQSSPREMQISVTEDRNARPQVDELDNPRIWEPEGYEIRKSSRQPRAWKLSEDTRTANTQEGQASNSWATGVPDVIPEGVTRSGTDNMPLKHSETRIRPQEIRIKTPDTEVVFGQNAEVHTNRTLVGRGEKVVIQADANADGELKTPLETGESGSRISMDEMTLALSSKQVSISGDQDVSIEGSAIRVRGHPDWPELMRYITALQARVQAAESRVSGLEGQVSQMSSQIASMK